MAKNKDLPSIGATEEIAIDASMAPKIEILTISVPSVILEEQGYCQRFIQLRLTLKQARRLRQIQIGLEERNATLEDGRYVNSPLDTVRWMLENAAG